MKKYISLLRYEFKTIIRDPINLYMCLFPIIVLLLSSFVFPLVFESMDQSQVFIYRITMLLFVIMILAFGSLFLGALATFLLLEHKDENTLNTIAVTPLRVSGYLRFKMIYIYLFSFLNTIIIVLGTKLIAKDAYSLNGVSLFDNINLFHIISFALVSALFTPVIGLLQAAFAKNKIEGFAYIKISGIIALIPAIMVLDNMQGYLQYILGVFPSFWALKAIMLELLPNNNASNLPYWGYLSIGLILNLISIRFAYKSFLKKANY